MATVIPLPELVKLAVIKGQFPRYVFKYRTLNAYFDPILINNQLWFSCPKDFNDPFDGQVTVDSNNTQAELENYIRKNNTIGLSNARISAIAKDTLNNPKKWHDMVNGVINQHINNKGVCCFAGDESNILLWSHYTDSHKGACLKFDILADPDFFVHLLKVNYQKNYPLYNHLKNPQDVVNLLINTKADVWAYEKEIRVLKFNVGLHTFKKDGLVEIIFGCKSDANEIKRIKTLATNNGYPHVTYRQARLKKQDYGLDFVNV